MHAELSTAMKPVFIGISMAIMVAYIGYRTLVTVVFLPFAGSLASPTGIYFIALVLAVTALGFTKLNGTAGLLALSLGVVALFYWWVVICRASSPIWSDFLWFVA